MHSFEETDKEINFQIGIRYLFWILYNLQFLNKYINTSQDI